MSEDNILEKYVLNICVQHSSQFWMNQEFHLISWIEEKQQIKKNPPPQKLFVHICMYIFSIFWIFWKYSIFCQLKKNVSLLLREISPLIAAWHHFVHISCNFRLDNSAEKMPISGGKECQYLGNKKLPEEKRKSVQNAKKVMLSSFNFWQAGYLAESDTECEF